MVVIGTYISIFDTLNCNLKQYFANLNLNGIFEGRFSVHSYRGY